MKENSVSQCSLWRKSDEVSDFQPELHSSILHSVDFREKYAEEGSSTFQQLIFFSFLRIISKLFSTIEIDGALDTNTG